jgi:hypothetical protein
MILLAAVGAALFATASLLPTTLLLPTVAVVAFALSVLVVTFGWWLGVARDQSEVTLWDIAGTCVLISVAAAILSDSHRATEAIASLLH